jgi:hypothetical protein
MPLLVGGDGVASRCKGKKKKKKEVAGVVPKGRHQDAKIVTYSDS